MIAPRMIYVASSWRNRVHPNVVAALRKAELEVYDFRHPHGYRSDGFRWKSIDPDWENWSAEGFREKLNHPLAVHGCAIDLAAMQSCDGCALVLPCGRSSHLEAGWFLGAGKRLVILLDSGEPELMYRLATHLVLSIDELVWRFVDFLPGGGRGEP